MPSRDWLVQAKLVVIGSDLPQNERNDCGLVIDGSTDRVPKRLKNPLIALRCTSLEFQNSFVSDLRMTALEVGSITEAG